MRTHHGNGNNTAVKCFSSSSSKTSRHVSALIFFALNQIISRTRNLNFNLNEQNPSVHNGVEKLHFHVFESEFLHSTAYWVLMILW